MTKSCFKITLFYPNSCSLTRKDNAMTWQELVNQINTVSGHQLMSVGGFLMEHRIYSRGQIRWAAYHEDLFTMLLAWQAMYDPWHNEWLWLRPPQENNQPVQTINVTCNNNVPREDQLPNCGSGRVFRVAQMYWRDPATVQTEGGLWVITPHCQKLLLDPKGVKNQM